MAVTAGLESAEIAIAGVGVAVAALRWLRVAQREHYLAGGVSRFAMRWWLVGPSNGLLAVVALIAVVLAVFRPWLGFIAVVVAAIAPLGLTLRGRTSKLAWTWRLRRLALINAILAAALVGVGAGLDGLRGVLVMALALGLLEPIVLDAALVCAVPTEELLARHFVERAAAVISRTKPRIVAITGSYGKTSTKGYLAHLLAGSFNVVASPRSFNNRAGLARTVNELLLPGTDVLIAEMGTYGVGEIAAMVEWLPPEVAVLTAIGPVHLERFKSLETTLRAKREITVGAAVVVVNDDDELLHRLADELDGAGKHVIRCSARRASAEVAVIADDAQVTVFASGCELGTVELGSIAASVAMSNLACALGACAALGLEIEQLLERVRDLPVAENRLTIRTAPSGATILDDTFNSNPSGGSLALQALSRHHAQGHRSVVVTPGMVELGSVQSEANAAFAGEAALVATDLIVVGRTNRRALLAGAEAAGAKLRVRTVRNRELASSILRDELGQDDVVLYENDLPDHYA